MSMGNVRSAILCPGNGLGTNVYVFLYYTYTFNFAHGTIQEKIREDPATHGAMFAPIVLGSDKTTVSVGTGQTEYYPLYISLGNLHNNVRRAHRNSVALLAFLAIPKSKYVLHTNHL